MDTKELERFCPWARQELVDAVRRGMVQLGVDEAGREQWPAGSEAVAGRALSPEERGRRDRLMAEAAAAGDAAFAEREAYSWFNRLIALRYMELHGLLPWGGRALSAADGSFAPELATRAADLPLANLDRAAYLERAAESDDEGAFRLALEAACAELAGALPGVFEGASCDLLPKGLLARGEHNVIQHLVEDVPEASWEDVEALGWAYQFYNSERKDEFFKSKRKAAAEDIAPATQLFTPDWIVRYMVQNSLGRLWMLNNPESPLRDKMEFYIEPDAEHEDFLRASGPEEITFCDPACGSGHILVYAFQLLTEMYRERGWRDRDIARSILEKNLSGYEIDPRAAQIAQTALCMEALALDRRWLSRGVAADVRVLQSIQIDQDALDPASALRERPQLLDALEHLGEIGSLFEPSPDDMGALKAELMHSLSGDLFVAKAQDSVKEAHDTCEALSRRFDVVVANPPYMGSSSFNPFVAKWIKKRYPDSCRDLCTAFIERGYGLAKDRGYAAMVTMASWMFLGSFEQMRKKIINDRGILSLLYMGHMVMRIAFNTSATVFYNGKFTGKGFYNRIDTKHLDENSTPIRFPAAEEPFHRADASTFHDIPGAPIAYWASENAINIFKSDRKMEGPGSVRSGMQTGNNDLFLRYWFEPSYPRIKFNLSSLEESETMGEKWVPQPKGGSYRKWYGNFEYVVNFGNGGKDLRDYPGTSIIKNPSFYFKEGFSWSHTTSLDFSARYLPTGCIFNVEAPSFFPNNHDLLNIALGYSNSSLFSTLFGFISQTMHYMAGDIARMPFPSISTEDGQISSLVNSNISISKADWDSQETSWDFKRNPLV